MNIAVADTNTSTLNSVGTSTSLSGDDSSAFTYTASNVKGVPSIPSNVNIAVTDTNTSTLNSVGTSTSLSGDDSSAFTYTPSNVKGVPSIPSNVNIAVTDTNTSTLNSIETSTSLSGDDSSAFTYTPSNVKGVPSIPSNMNIAVADTNTSTITTTSEEVTGNDASSFTVNTSEIKGIPTSNGFTVTHAVINAYRTDLEDKGSSSLTPPDATFKLSSQPQGTIVNKNNDLDIRYVNEDGDQTKNHTISDDNFSSALSSFSLITP